jgi:triosephosphate isomerase
MKNTKTEEKILVVANWKMNQEKIEHVKQTAEDIKKTASQAKHVEVVICPSDVHIPYVQAVTKKGQVVLGAQNVSSFEKGSYTGEVSAMQLANLGVEYCIVGHSERRETGETNEMISQKIQLLLKKNIIPILCVGEKVRDEKGQYLHDIETQIKESLANIPKKFAEKIVFAYEPLWAIGKNANRSATSQEIQEIVIVIRRTLSDMYEMKKIPHNVILYGGSVTTKKDIGHSIMEGYTNGCLIGRASLSSKTCTPLIEEANKLAKK